jgi:hypothetical protein
MRRAQLLLIGILACRPTAPRPPETPPLAASVAPSPLRFAWPADARATVTERVLKKGRHATMRYSIVTQREGPTTLVYYRDFAFVELEGFDLADREVREMIAKLERQVAGAIPPYRIAADGTWLGCGEIGTMLDGLEGILPAADIATFREMMANPSIRAVVDAKLRDVWQAWVEGWLGLELRPGQFREGSSKLEIAGTVVDLPYMIERLPGDDATIEVRATSELSGDAAIAMVGALIAEVVETLPGRADMPRTVEEMRKLTVLRAHLREATIDRATMLPIRAFNRVSIMVSDGQAVTESIESHEWLFEWNDR